MKKIKLYLLLPILLAAALFALGSLYPESKHSIKANSQHYTQHELRVEKAEGYKNNCNSCDFEADYKRAKESFDKLALSVPSGKKPFEIVGVPWKKSIKIVGVPEGSYYRIANIRIEVSAFLQTYEKIEDVLKEKKCEIVESSIEGNDDFRSGYIYIRVPADNFNDVIKQIRKQGKVKGESIKSQLVENPKTKSDSEKLELHYIRVELSDKPNVEEKPSEDKGVLANAFNKSSVNFARGSALLVEGLGYILPFVLLVGIFGFVGLTGTRLFRITKHERKEIRID